LKSLRFQLSPISHPLRKFSSDSRPFVLETRCQEAGNELAKTAKTLAKTTAKIAKTMYFMTRPIALLGW
jgi:hypothetical protein